MDFFSIPDDLNVGREAFDGIQIIPYQSEGDSMRHRVMFNCHVLSFLQRGQKIIHQHEKPIKLEEGNFGMIKMGKCLMTERSSGGGYQSLMLCFGDQVLQNFRLKYQDEVLEYKKPNNIVRFYFDDFSSHFLQSLELLYRRGADKRILAIKLEEILFYLLKTHPQILSSILSHGKNEDEVHFRMVVENNLLLDLKLEELAFLCHMSVSTFKRHFQKYYGTSPHKWMLEKKWKWLEFC